MTTCGLPNREGGGHGGHSKNEAMQLMSRQFVRLPLMGFLICHRYDIFGVGRGRCVGLNSTSDALSRYFDLSTKLIDSSGGDPALSEVSRSHATQSMRAPCICQRIIGYG
jgi:hypothetical protein